MFSRKNVDPLVFLAIIFIALVFSLTYFQGTGSYIPIHDSLDTFGPVYTVMSPGTLFAGYGTEFPNQLGGIPRDVLGSEFSLGIFIHTLLPLIWAYAVIDILVALIAFSGMYLLLRDHLAIKDPQIVAGAALCFSLLPFLHPMLFTITAMPLVFWGFLAIVKEDYSIHHVIALLVYPFLSNLVFGGFVTVGVLFLIILFGTPGKGWPAKLKLMIWPLLLTVIAVLVDWRLFYMILADADYVSHREQRIVQIYPLKTAVLKSLRLGFSGHYTVATFHKWIILPVVALHLSHEILTRRKPSRTSVILILALAASSFFYGFYDTILFSGIRTASSTINSLNLERIYNLSQFSWYIFFAVGLTTLKGLISNLKSFPKLSKGIIPGLILAQLGVVLYHSDANTQKRTYGLTVADYTAPELFSQIEKEIGRDKSSYRVGSIGLHPIFALYNGFYTVDGYLANYPMETKVKFRKLIANELDRSEKWASYFDGWGNRAYIFASNAEDYENHRPQRITEPVEMYLNPSAYADLDCEYLISAWPIKDPEKIGLTPRGRFETEDSAFILYLYETTAVQN